MSARGWTIYLSALPVTILRVGEAAVLQAPPKAFNLTRLSACRLGGRAFVQEGAMQRPCTSSIVQSNVGGGRFPGWQEIGL
jgi:hypothetical protein